jgi:serpin B
MTRRRYRVLTGILIGAGTAACVAASAPGAVAAPAVVAAPGVTRAVAGSDAPVAAVVAGITAFGYRLSTSTADPARNWVASPLSIATAFAMARAGAGGETAAQIDRQFGFPPGVHEGMNALGTAMGASDQPPPATGARQPLERPVLCLANGLFVQSGFAVRESFLRTLGAHYGAGARAVDFRTPLAKEQIDAWVRARTADRIKELFDRLPKQTRVVLANAVYLKADWSVPFRADTTADAAFTRGDGRVVRVPTMGYEGGGLRYASGPGWQAVELPYRGGDLAMRVVVPEPGRPAPPLLAPEVLAAVAAGLAPTRVDLMLPKWNFETKLDLKEALAALGLTLPFTPDAADFSGIATALYIDQAVHRAAITVDEKGTEAAAVTGLGMRTTAAQSGVLVRADHPFAYAIVHVPTGAPLFTGWVADPSR